MVTDNQTLEITKQTLDKTMNTARRIMLQHIDSYVLTAEMVVKAQKVWQEYSGIAQLLVIETH